jgi:hypothetical protein
MKTHHCCAPRMHGRDNAPRPTSRWRGGGQAGPFIVPGVLLVLIPKCPACLVGYVAAFTGLSLSLTIATYLRASVLILCVAAIFLIVAKTWARR